MGNLDIEFLIRIILAGVLGALIGLEREKRFKEAGLRTHFLVAIGSAIIMIISKYGFADVIGKEGFELDPSRIAAQVVSGVGFLGAGMILVQRQSIHGLTTAAGIWTTAGIGLAIGAGLYEVGIAGSVLVLVGLELLKRVFQFAIPKAYQLTTETSSRDAIQSIIHLLSDQNMTIKDYHVKVKGTGTDTKYVVSFKLQSSKIRDSNELAGLLQQIPEISAVKLQ
ncbi:MgtC/SapB family protein [Virgibacillus halophilus]|uniref:MgtC/SapB family protein n=1 Tax=Tigheibacillus halophilus TaxID=361280 RepID=A0ABU5C7U1_9BACI|nr:MgtC/SapB family protein [Virgibacillus halophilus]